MRRAVTVSVAILLIFFAGWIWLIFYQLNYSPLIQSATNLPIIHVNKSISAAAFTHLLKKRQLIASERSLLLYMRLFGLTHQLKAGIYEIHPNESAIQFLHRVLAGDVLVKSFRITEGETWSHVLQHLQEAPFLTYQSGDEAFITQQSAGVEGLLLADTYSYPAGSRSSAILKKAHDSLMHYLQQAWKNRQSNLPYRSDYELLIAASIIEKETALSNERRLIADVLVNRLQLHMPLQMDPTVIYGLGNAYKGKLTHADMQIDSPYNSYKKRGLPPTPIAMVGRDAIDAAAQPIHTNYIYFVAKGDGSHQFSTTYQEQREAITHFLRKTS